MTAATARQADLLATIIAATRRTLEARDEREPLKALERRALRRDISGGRFARAISTPGRMNVIAECKRRSPSRGVLRARYDPVEIAREYEAAGAAAISVLTEPCFFDGSLGHLAAVSDAVRVPLLRKDFVVSEYQLLEARAAGADAVLLIVAALSVDDLRRLFARATELGLDTLVEVHTADELAIATDAGARIVGVNNRNLRTLEVDLKASAELIAQMSKGIIAVSESGIHNGADVRRLGELGYSAVLIGERFMAAPHAGTALADLLAQSSNGAQT